MSWGNKELEAKFRRPKLTTIVRTSDKDSLAALKIDSNSVDISTCHYIEAPVAAAGGDSSKTF